MTSDNIRRLAAQDALWHPLLTHTYGDFYAQTGLTLPVRGPHMMMRTFGLLHDEIKQVPSLFFRSLLVSNDGRVDGEPPAAARSRVALWAPRFTLVEDRLAPQPMVCSPDGASARCAPATTPDPESLARFVDTSTHSQRVRTFEAPYGEAHCTVEMMLRAVSARTLKHVPRPRTHTHARV
jgi:hypothetical protein